MPRVKYMRKTEKELYQLDRYPSFSATGSIYGMKKKYYGMDALLVLSGSWIYKVPPEIYNVAH